MTNKGVTDEVFWDGHNMAYLDMTTSPKISNPGMNKSWNVG